MRSNAFSRIIVVKKEDKEPKLRAFIAAFLDRALRGEPGASLDCLVIARSAESPVVKALASFSSSEYGAKLRPRVLLTAEDADFKDGRPPQFLDELDIDHLRLSRDSRLLEAHEQLVLGPDTVWIGDCMRRDPAIRDAFESYGDTSAEMARAARTAFERLWDAVSQADSASAEPSAFAAIEAALAMAHTPAQEPAPETAVTRH